MEDDSDCLLTGPPAVRDRAPSTFELNRVTDSAAERPIIILGVPRGGTTLLRVLLGSHPRIQAASETPWTCGGYGANSLRHLIDHLKNDHTGPRANMSGVTEDDLLEAAEASCRSSCDGIAPTPRRSVFSSRRRTIWDGSSFSPGSFPTLITSTSSEMGGTWPVQRFGKTESC
jgi:hypothetical protein